MRWTTRSTLWDSEVGAKAQRDASTERVYFFDTGLRFTCVECGRCCTGEPGATIHASPQDQAALAAHLRITRSALRRNYLRSVGSGYSIRDRADGECIFLADGRCRVYPARPTQCRTYPFWFKNLRSELHWQRVMRQCPGIGQGCLHDREKILAHIAEDLDSDRPSNRS